MRIKIMLCLSRFSYFFKVSFKCKKNYLPILQLLFILSSSRHLNIQNDDDYILPPNLLLGFQRYAFKFSLHLLIPLFATDCDKRLQD